MSKDVNISQGCPLTRHTPKSFLLALILGVFIGLAVIVPGVSGSTVAIIFGMYGAMLYAIGNIFNDFKRCLLYLIPIGLGVIVGFLGGFLVIQNIFGRYMFVVVCLFAGLMVGATPALTAEISKKARGAERVTLPRTLLLALGVLIPLGVGAVSIMLGAESGGESFSAFPAHLFILYIPLGAIVSATQIIPGLSATAVLMACGQFKPILNSLHLDYILENPAVLGLYLCLGGGFLVGLVLISRLFSAILEKHRVTAFFLVVGLSLGSILSMFLNPDMWEIYCAWAGGKDPTTELLVGIPLALVGFAASFALTRYELRRASAAE